MTNNNFRDSIEFHFGDRNDIKNKQFLGQLMRKRQFFNASKPNRRVRQAQKLTTSAWISLKYKREELSFIVPTGFKKKQIRDKATGRILGWE